MLKFAIFLLFISVSFAQVRVRMEVRELIRPDGSRAQGLQDFIDGVRCVMNMRGTTRGRSEWDEMSSLHFSQAGLNHGFTRFLPWHRLFLLGMEEAMTRCLRRPVTIPYWNSAIDASITGGVRRSPLFRHLDGEGRCVFNATVAIPQPHCLSRSFDNSLNLATREQVARLIETDDFETMTSGLEGFVHGTPHVFIGGDMRNMYSSNDPIFYMHHANVDRIWHTWQALHPGNASTFTGFSPVSRREASVSDRMSIGYGSKYARDRTVRELLSISTLGYSYSTGPTPVREAPAPATGGTSRRLLDDRSESSSGKVKVQLKYLEPLPADWVQHNNLDPVSLERRREKVNRYTSWLNSIPNYFPRVIGRDVKYFRSRSRREYEERANFLIDTVKVYKAERKNEKEGGRGGNGTGNFRPNNGRSTGTGNRNTGNRNTGNRNTGNTNRNYPNRSSRN